MGEELVVNRITPMIPRCFTTSSNQVFCYCFALDPFEYEVTSCTFCLTAGYFSVECENPLKPIHISSSLRKQDSSYTDVGSDWISEMQIKKLSMDPGWEWGGGGTHFASFTSFISASWFLSLFVLLGFPLDPPPPPTPLFPYKYSILQFKQN